MARGLRKKSVKKAPKIKAQRNLQKGFFSKIKLTESYTSLILGAIVVLIVGILFISFAKGNKNTQTSSASDVSKAENQKSTDSQTSSTYTVRPGDDLWTISEAVYDNGYKWVEIAKINNLENPGLIYAGSKLIVPSVSPTITQEETIIQGIKQAPQNQSSVIQNSSITQNTYTVVEGDNLWDIAVRAYGDGFKWPEIARANNLANPNLIHPGNVFKIPR